MMRVKPAFEENSAPVVSLLTESVPPTVRSARPVSADRLAGGPVATQFEGDDDADFVLARSVWSVREVLPRVSGFSCVGSSCSSRICIFCCVVTQADCDDGPVILPRRRVALVNSLDGRTVVPRPEEPFDHAMPDELAQVSHSQGSTQSGG